MSPESSLEREILSCSSDGLLEELYGIAGIESHRKRYVSLLRRFNKRFKATPCAIFSAPGRVELGGNHTDHNNGRVIAGSIDLDTIGIASPNTETDVIQIDSEGYPAIDLALNSLDPIPGEEGTTEALVRGIAKGVVDRGGTVGGFYASVTSNVLEGSGLSSSASIEILVASIFNGLYNQGKLPPLELARIAQFAENNYYGKPSGLMDQIASAHGGLIFIDFKDNESPKLSALDVTTLFKRTTLAVINTGGDHAELSHHYAEIPREMRSVARELGREVLRGCTLSELFENATQIRERLGDRAFLRGYHFITEDLRVEQEAEALASGNLATFTRLVSASGNSSFRYLQNITPAGELRHQELAVGIAAAEELLAGEGAVRVHGGGFAGTLLSLMPEQRFQIFSDKMDSLFGTGAVQRISIRGRPAGQVL